MTDLHAVKTEESEGPTYASCWEVTGCSRSDYMSCAAFQQRKNCYELDRVICCTKHRDNCAACPVYVAINRVVVEKIRVQVCTDRFDVTGDLHMPVGARLSDFMNRSERPFIVLTDARITPANQPDRVTEDSIAILNKAHVILVWQVDEAADGATAA